MKLKYFLFGVMTFIATPLFSQTLDTEALAKVNPAASRQVYEVAQHVKLTAKQQLEFAKALQKENAKFLEIMKQNLGVMTAKGKTQLAKMRDNAISTILDAEQQAQYYRGVFDAEADAEGNRIADTLQKKYNLTDQNWKFIRIAFYKIGLETRVLNKMLADTPKKAAQKIKELRREYLNSIEEKGGLRVNTTDANGKEITDPNEMTVTWVRDFDPNALRK